MEEYGMAESSGKTSQIHVREGTTEQAWISELIETELKDKAPDLWSKKLPSTRKGGR